MAMTITFDVRRPQNLGIGYKITTGHIAFSSSYTSSGEVVTPAEFGFETEILCLFCYSGHVAKRIEYDADNALLHVWAEDGSSGVQAEVSGSSDPGVAAATFVAIGR